MEGTENSESRGKKKLQVFACKRQREDFTVWVTEFALGSRLSIDIIAENNSKGKIYYLTPQHLFT